MSIRWEFHENKWSLFDEALFSLFCYGKEGISRDKSHLIYFTIEISLKDERDFCIFAQNRSICIAESDKILNLSKNFLILLIGKKKTQTIHFSILSKFMNSDVVVDHRFFSLWHAWPRCNTHITTKWDCIGIAVKWWWKRLGLSCERRGREDEVWRVKIKRKGIES